MERRARHHRASHPHRIELSHRREGTSAPHLYGDIAQERGLLFGRELIRDRPARGTRGESQFALLSEGIDLHHHPIDLIRQAVAHL